MKRFFKTSFAMLLALLLVVGLLPAIAQADDLETLTVYDGTDANGTVPVYGLYADAYHMTQYVIPADDLVDMDGGIVEKLTYYCANKETVDWGDAEFKVYMGEISATTLDAFVDWNDLELVMEGSLGIANYLMEIDLDTPYEYQGGNLLIGVQCVTIGTWISANWVGTNVTGASLMGYSYTSLDDISEAQRNFIPKTTFSFEPGNGIKEITITADDKSIFWGEAEPELTATITGRLAATDPVFQLEREPGDEPGDYAIHVVFDAAQNPDYVITAVDGTLTIKKLDSTLVPPTPKALQYTGEAQALVEAGSTEDGTMAYSLDGVNFAAEIPTAADPGPYDVWFKVIGDAHHNDSKPDKVVSTIGIALYSEDINALDSYEVIDGERVTKLNIYIGNIPEAGLDVNSMQIFLEYDPDLAEIVDFEGPEGIDWIGTDDEGLLAFSWASFEEVHLDNNDVVLTLFVVPTDDGYGEIVEFEFTQNKLGFDSAVGAVRDGKTIEIPCATDGGAIVFDEPLFGDANLDGKVSSADAAQILRAVVGLTVLSPRAAAYADVDMDGEVTAEDAAYILSYIINLIEALPVQPA